MDGTLTITIAEIGHRSELTVDVDYVAYPGEAMVMYYPNGDGYPGSPPYAELLNVRVVEWDVGDEVRPRGSGWVWDELDRIARDLIESDWDSYGGECLEDASMRESDRRCEHDD